MAMSDDDDDYGEFTFVYNYKIKIIRENHFF